MKSTQKWRHGSENSSANDSSQMEMLIPEASPNCDRTISWDIPPVTSLPGSVAGPTLCASPDGQTTIQSGREAAHASRLAALEKEWGNLTSGISGPSSEILSASATLQSALGNKLRARLDVNGSPEYVLTWKHWDMRSGVPICALRASHRPTSAKDYIGWPTPGVSRSTESMEATKNWGDRPNKNGQNLEGVAALSGWTTPQAHDSSPRGAGQKQKHGTMHGCADLNADAKMAGWASPRVSDTCNKSWETKCARNSKHLSEGRNQRKGVGGPTLPMLAGWVSPTAQDSNRGSLPPRPQDSGTPLSQQVSGMTVDGTSAGMKNTAGFLLNPRFSLWLMGFPVAWASCGERAMQLFLSLRRSSSKHTSKPKSKISTPQKSA